MENQQPQKNTNKPIKFFTTYFCPWAQQVQIAFNEAGEKALEQIEYAEALTLHEDGETEVNPEMAALGRKQTPTLLYKNQVLVESKELIRIIDKEFTNAQYTIVPAEEKLRNYAFFQEDYIREKLLPAYLAIIIKIDKESQDKAKIEFLQHIFNITQGYKGPYYLGEQFSTIDITMAPFFLRMFVLEKLRNFSVPKTQEFTKWFEWSANVLNRKCVADAKVDEEKLYHAYEILIIKITKAAQQQAQLQAQQQQQQNLKS